MWADAANKAKSTDAAEVAAALRSGTYNSAVGPLTYDAKGDIKDPVYDIYVWKGGKSPPGEPSKARHLRRKGPAHAGPFFLLRFKVLV